MIPVDDKSAVLKVKFSVGYVSKTFELRVRFKDMVPDSLVSFVGEGSDAQVVGTVSLKTGSRPGSTVLGYKIQIRPLSAIGRTAVTLLGRELVKSQTESFAGCVRAKLEARDP